MSERSIGDCHAASHTNHHVFMMTRWRILIIEILVQAVRAIVQVVPNFDFLGRSLAIITMNLTILGHKKVIVGTLRTLFAGHIVMASWKFNE